MKRFRRYLALMLSVFLIAGSVQAPVFAAQAETETEAEVISEAEEETLSAEEEMAAGSLEEADGPASGESRTDEEAVPGKTEGEENSADSVQEEAPAAQEDEESFAPEDADDGAAAAEDADAAETAEAGQDASAAVDAADDADGADAPAAGEDADSSAGEAQEDYEEPVQEIPAEAETAVKEEVSTDRSASAEEHENDFDQAVSISEGESIDTEVTDEDPYAFYCFTPEEDGIYAFYSTSENDTYADLFRFDPGTGDYVHIDYNDDGGYDYGHGSNFRLTSTCTAGETYYLRARSFNTGACSFTVSVERDTAAEESDPFLTAEEIAVPGFAEGEISEERQEKYYRFTTEEDGFYVIYAESGCDTLGMLYDAGRNLTDSDDDSAEGNNFSITRFLQGGETWYISVTMAGFDTGSYTLHIDRDEEGFYILPVGDTVRTVEPGEEVELGVRTQSASEVSYSWYVDGRLVQDGSSDRFVFTPDQNCEVVCEASDQDDRSGSCLFDVQIRAAWTLTTGDPQTLVVGPEESAELHLQTAAEDGYENTYNFTYFWLDGDRTELENDNADPSVYTVRDVDGAVSILGCARDQYGTEQSIRFILSNPGHLNVWPGNDSYDWTTGGSSYTYKVDQGDTAWLRVYREDIPEELSVSYIWTEEDGAELEEYRDSETCEIYDVQENRTVCCHAEAEDGSSADLTFYIRIGSTLTVYPVGNEDTGDMNLDVDILGQDPVTLSVHAENSQGYALTCQWRKFTRSDSEYGHEWGDSDNIEGATEADLVVTDPDINDIYCCFVRDEDGNEASAIFSLYADTNLEAYIGTGEDDPDEEWYSSRITLDADNYDSITLIARGESEDPDRITYQWYKTVGDGEEEKLTGETESTLEVTGPENGSSYLCRVGDGYGNMREVWCDFRHNNHLEVRVSKDTDDSWLYIDPRSDNTFTLTPYVKADDMSGLTYTWTKTASGEEDVIVGTDSTLYVDHSPDSWTEYHLRVTDSYGNEGNAFFVFQIDTKLRAYPETAAEGQDTVSVVVGGQDSVTLTAVVECEEGTALHYSWSRDYEPIEDWSGEFEGPGVLTCVVDSPEGGAQYRCTVADEYGNQVDATFNLLDSAPALTARPEGAEPDEDTAHITYDERWQSDSPLQVIYTGETPEEEVLFTWKDGNGIVLESAYAQTGYYSGGYTDGATFSCTLTDDYGQSLTVYFVLAEKVRLGVYPEGDDVGSAWKNQYDTTYSGEEKLSIDVGQEPLLKTIVDLSPEGDYTCTWYASGKLYPDDDEWGEPLAGETGETLQAKASYKACKCVVEAKKDGTRAEAIFRLEVMNHLTVYPEGNRRGDESVDLYTKPGDQAVLRVAAEAEDLTDLVYEWKQYEELGDGEGTWKSLGVSEDTLTTDALDSNTDFKCEVTDRYGNTQEAWFYVHPNRLTLYPAGQTSSRDYLDIETAPGKDVLLQAKVETDDPDHTTVTWQRYDEENDELVNLGEDPDAAASGMAEYTVKAVSQSCLYRCLAEDAYGNSKEASFGIDVNHFDAFIAGDPDSQYRFEKVVAGRELKLAAAAEGDDLSKVTYTWENEDGEPVTEGVSAKGDVLTLEDPEAGNLEYFCKISDGYGNEVSLTFKFYVMDLVAEADGDDWFRVPAGDTVTMKVKAETSAKDGSLSYCWKDADENPVQGETKDTFTVKAERNAEYYCLVTDGNGEEKEVRFEIVIDNHLNAWVKGDPDHKAEGNVYVPVGGKAQLAVEYEADDRDGVTITWETGGEVLDSHDAALTTPEIKGWICYWCTVQDRFGNCQNVWFYVDTRNFNARAEGAEDGDTNVIVDCKEGEPVELKTIVTDVVKGEKISYQWFESPRYQYEWDRIVGATDSTYTVRFVIPGTGYRCRVSDSHGNTVDIRFTLRTNQLKAEPADGEDAYIITAAPGQKVTLRVTVSAEDMSRLEYEWLEDNDVSYELFTDDPLKCRITAPSYEGEFGYFFNVYDQYGNDDFVRFTIIVDKDYVPLIDLSDEDNETKIEVADTDLVYDGKAKTPAVTVTCADKTLDPRTDYTVEYKDNINAGTATVTVTGKGDYTESASAGFTIARASIKDAQVTGISDQVHTGKAITQKPVVKLGGKTLKADTDYTVSYKNNTNVGTATVTITGKGNYTDSLDKTFQITAADVAVERLTLDKSKASVAATKTLQLKATFDPTNATDQTLTWKSTNAAVASVDENGLVKAKKRGAATITATTANGKTAKCEVTVLFADVANSGKSYFKPVYWAVDEGITNVSVYFRPEDPVTRGEFVAFLYRLAGKPKASGKVNFKDVNSGSKFYNEIRWAVGKGIIKGYKDGTFKAEKEVTRGETAIMIWRYAGKKNPKTKKSPFSDLKYSTSDTCKAILWGSENGIIKGSGGKFLKDDGCTRGQVVTFLYRYANK